MSEHEPETGARDPRSLVAEADYWMALLSDVKAISGHLSPAATACCEVPVAMLEAMISPDVEGAIDRANAAARQVLRELEAISERVEAIGELAGGRLLMLRREAGLEG